MWLRRLTISLVGLVVLVALAAVLNFSGLFSDRAPARQLASPPSAIESNPLSSESPTLQQDPNYGPFIFAIAVLSVATAVSVLVAFYLYRWRRILLSNPHVLLPEEQGAYFQSLDAHFRQLHNGIVRSFDGLREQGNASVQRMSELHESFMTLQRALEQRDAEIQRLRKGYDAEVYRKFINRFIRVSAALHDMKAISEVRHGDVDQAIRLLDDAFEECGVEVFFPELGADYRLEKGVADNPQTVPTENQDELFKIAGVLEAGYRIRSGDSQEIIRAAKVKIFAM
jgi:hypothetical protein